MLWLYVYNSWTNKSQELIHLYAFFACLFSEMWCNTYVGCFNWNLRCVWVFFIIIISHGSWFPHNRDVRQEGWKSCATLSAQRGESLCVTRTLPDWTRELLKKPVSVVSTCILHDNITGGILMFCKVLNILRLVFLWQSWRPSPRSPSSRTSWAKSWHSVRCPWSSRIFDYWSKMPFEPV